MDGCLLENNQNLISAINLETNLLTILLSISQNKILNYRFVNTTKQYKII